MINQHVFSAFYLRKNSVFEQCAVAICTTIILLLLLAGCAVENTKNKTPSDALKFISTVSIQPVGVPQPVDLNEIFPPNPNLSPEVGDVDNKNHTQQGEN